MLRVLVLTTPLLGLTPALAHAGDCSSPMLLGTIVVEPEADRAPQPAPSTEARQPIERSINCTVAVRMPAGTGVPAGVMPG